MAEKLKALERENRELRQANESCSSLRIEMLMGSSRSAGFCRSPHQATMNALPSAAILSGGLPDSNVTRASSRKPCAPVQCRGLQYVSIRHTERLAEAGIEPSVGSVGDSYDNALAESINGFHKAEVIHRRWPWRNIEAVEFATLEWVDWFNHRRLLEPIGNIPPAEAEANFYAALEQPAMAAKAKPNSLRISRRGSSATSSTLSDWIRPSRCWLTVPFRRSS
jgi:hypothetical protein